MSVITFSPAATVVRGAYEDDLPDLRLRLRDRAELLVEYLLGEPKERSRKELRFGRNKGSLIVVISGENRGLWFDHGTGKGGDLFELIMQERRCDFAEALRWARRWLGDPERRSTGRPVPPRPAEAKQADDPARYARRLLLESRPIEATLVERYLREHRGIDGPLPCELRFHPAVWSSETGSTHPAMLVPAFEGDEIRRVQAVLLNPETAAKASVEPAKLTFGRDAAHVPAVFAPIVEDERVYLAEGPEDAITVWSVTGCCTLVAFGASSLEKIELPPGTDLTICADADDTGREAAHRAAQAYADAGCHVRIAFPGLQ